MYHIIQKQTPYIWGRIYWGRPLEYWLIYEGLFNMVTACHGKLA